MYLVIYSCIFRDIIVVKPLWFVTIAAVDGLHSNS